MSALHTTTTADFDTGITEIGVRGILEIASTSTLRASVRRAADEFPYAVLLDLNEVVVRDDVALLVLATLTSQLNDELVRCAVYMRGGPNADRVRRVVGARVGFATDRTEAMALLDRHCWARRRMHMRLRPVAGSVSEARTLVNYACASWSLGDRGAVAGLIATELASNAVAHTRADYDLTVVAAGDHLFIQVRDRSRQLPALVDPVAVDAPGGRGLRVIDALAASWGAVPTDTGKTVWASLRIARPGSAA